MPSDIPPIDPDVPEDESFSNDQRNQLEFDLLTAEAERARAEINLLNLTRRELGQRYVIRWLAVGVGGLVIAGMSLLLGHLTHNLFWGPFVFAGPAFSVAMIAGPILSITTITVALFVGAFRKFEDKDLEVIGTGIAGAASAMRGS